MTESAFTPEQIKRLRKIDLRTELLSRKRWPPPVLPGSAYAEDVRFLLDVLEPTIAPLRGSYHWPVTEVPTERGVKK